MIKIAFFDIDGTLFDNKLEKWSYKTLEGIKELQRKGVKVILCSARPYHSMEKFGVFDLGISWDGWIGSAGATASYQNEVLRYESLDKETIERFINKVKEDHFTMELVEIFDRKLVYPQTKESMNFYDSYKESIPDFGKYEGEIVVSFNLFAPKGIEEEYQKEFPNLIINRFFETALDVMDNQHLKSNGMNSILAKAGFKKEESIAFGDDLQDIPMAEASGIFVCMGQGKEEVKKAATFITKPIEEDGVYYALKHFKLIEG